MTPCGLLVKYLVNILSRMFSISSHMVGVLHFQSRITIFFKGLASKEHILEYESCFDLWGFRGIILLWTEMIKVVRCSGMQIVHMVAQATISDEQFC